MIETTIHFFVLVKKPVLIGLVMNDISIDSPSSQHLNKVLFSATDFVAFAKAGENAILSE